MGRPKHLRGISKDRVYVVRMAARLVGVSEPTFRKWSKDGLRLIKDKRPHLVRGADIIDYLARRKARSRWQMAPDQFACMRCKGPSKPLEGSIQYHSQTNSTGRLSALCNVCTSKMGRFCSASERDRYDLSGPVARNGRKQA
ncbi:helix-turn-helix domain-containing protein [uncultured Roseobacter sp.]|uniref:helix-turn-helix domain-containing protein n=1 Tax=uncultured Roseobacter sp. TaxID=114847 RepID=UPI00262FEB4D|nr:helix-turn-helix domain-containing protein [uncultured Roseobacter sp.]